MFTEIRKKTYLLDKLTSISYEKNKLANLKARNYLGLKGVVNFKKEIDNELMESNLCSFLSNKKITSTTNDKLDCFTYLDMAILDGEFLDLSIKTTRFIKNRFNNIRKQQAKFLNKIKDPRDRTMFSKWKNIFKKIQIAKIEKKSVTIQSMILFSIANFCKNSGVSPLNSMFNAVKADTLCFLQVII